jgi:histidinol-phosphate/aromatic aminotransferase/cobyric acid decarboxylase-like protein
MITRLLSPKVILTSTPTFGMYSFLAKVAAARVIDVPRKVPLSHAHARTQR